MPAEYRSRADWLKAEEEFLAPESDPGSPRPVRKLKKKKPIVVWKLTWTGFGAQAWAEARGFFLDTKLNLLMVALPLAVISHELEWGDAPTFTLSWVSLIPLAERLGYVTEQMAMYTNDTLGGLLTASFGNATEVIISGFALSKGYLRVVQLSLIGSIASNLLLVLGSAFLAGGIRNANQSFNQAGVNVNSGLLILSIVAIILPSLLSETHTEVKSKRSELALSRIESIFLLGCYAVYLVFQLCTHRHLYEDMTDEEDPPVAAVHGTAGLPISTALEVELSNGGTSGLKGLGVGGIGLGGLESQPLMRKSSEPIKENGLSVLRSIRTATEAIVSPAAVNLAVAHEEGEGIPTLTITGCAFWMTFVSLLIALLSEYVMSAIKGASQTMHIPLPFLVTILLPIVGNAAEHASAIVFAYRNKIEIALGVAVGSATQIAVLVIPCSVLLAWMLGQPLDLNFNAFESATLFLSVLLTIIVLQDGRANYLKGVMLVLTYIFVAVSFWFHKDKFLTADQLSGA